MKRYTKYLHVYPLWRGNTKYLYPLWRGNTNIYILCEEVTLNTYILCEEVMLNYTLWKGANTYKELLLPWCSLYTVYRPKMQNNMCLIICDCVRAWRVHDVCVCAWCMRVCVCVCVCACMCARARECMCRRVSDVYIRVRSFICGVYLFYIKDYAITLQYLIFLIL